MAVTVHVKLAERGYDIKIDEGPAFGLSSLCRSGEKFLIVSDSNVDPLYGLRVERELTESGGVVSRAMFPAGESSKDIATLEWLYSKAVESGLERSSTVIALGGGVVGDIAGFLAATYMRGIRLIQAPTSLLAMVDSSVGGKTAINLPQGKNLVGAFYQPGGVCINLSALNSLPEREYLSGIAEVIKYGIIRDAAFFEYLEASMEKLVARDSTVLAQVIARSCEIKAEVVALDERESGVRAVLNFGHTFGHALEQVAGYGTLLHGEAVAIGMVYAAEVSRREKGFPEADSGRIVSLLRRAGLPVAVSEGAYEWDDLRRAMSGDKKAVDALPRFVLASRIGEVVFGAAVSAPVLEKAADELHG